MNKAFVGFGAMALGIVGAAVVASTVASSDVPLPITGAPVAITRADFSTASGLARPFAGALASNRLADSNHWAQAQSIVTTGNYQLADGVTARAVLQSLAAQNNKVATALPASWR